MSLSSVRSPLRIGACAPNAPAVDVTMTSASTLLSRVTTFWYEAGLPPSDWYDSSATTRPPSCRQRALNAWTTLRK